MFSGNLLLPNLVGEIDESFCLAGCLFASHCLSSRVHFKDGDGNTRWVKKRNFSKDMHIPLSIRTIYQTLKDQPAQMEEKNRWK